MEIAETAKYVQIAELFKRRIRNGDYNFCAMPGAPRLAQETGVSYMTARQAIQKLIDDGVLQRAGNGRLEVKQDRTTDKTLKKVVFVRPATDFSHSIWRQTISQLVGEFHCQFREIVYCHDDDPLLTDVLDGDFDLIFLMFQRMDSLFLEKLKRNRHRLVTLFHDLSAHGIRCLDGMVPSSITHLIKYLHDQGHRRIDCLNSQPFGPAIQDRIDCWQSALQKFGCTGELHNHPTRNFSPAAIHAKVVMDTLLTQKKLNATAMFCASVECAMGAIRSCHEHHLRVPEDLSVASFGNPDTASIFIPSITVIDMPSPAPVIRPILERMLGYVPDDGRLVFRLETDSPVLLGESTGKNYHETTL